jgi:signal transduction histidine kinase
VDHLSKLVRTVRWYLIGVFLAYDILVVALWWMFAHVLSQRLTDIQILIALGLLSPVLILVFAFISAAYVTSPLRAIWQTILHISPTEHNIAPPKIESLRLGRELVASLSAQIYQLASNAETMKKIAQKQSHDLTGNFIANNMPLPLIILNKYDMIMFANNAATTYLGQPLAEVIGKNAYTVLDVSFQSADTLETWLKTAKQESATAVKSWERVKFGNIGEGQPNRYLDLAAFYNRDNPDNIETMLVLFDHTAQYSKDDDVMSVLALSVHELRTPLTLLRGYIETFQDELQDQLDPELTDFMFKMNASAQQLTAFVNNILNVARVDGDQLVLELHEEKWDEIIRSAANTLALRAKVRGITLEFSIASGLPTVGVDRVSIYEVISNLVDNAIKYSSNGKRIRIDTRLNQEGLVETTVQDWGVGIPTAIVPNLFTKFYRNHRNKSQIGGTGLGLYLSKAIVGAHGGNIWVRSKDGQGSTFGFTVLPYSKLDAERKASGNQDITRGAHGWIKNHSLYRR